jgi:putative endonuclease
MASSKSESSQQSPHDPDHFDLGRRGEAYAAAFLEQRGYRIVGANFSLPVGRNLRGVLVNAEIDLVAYDGPTLCFIEVKTRSSDWFAPPQVNIDLRKQRQVARAARRYRRMFGLESSAYRFDVVTVVLPPAHIQKAMQIELLRNYWNESSLRKRKRYQEWYCD